ncbi:major capsid protein [Flyfo microvirus Tbat2_93]|nr:major capsid protein [Flyfo microvirus Tbat2_93]
MARQSTSPVQFNQSTRRDTAVLMTSARAGVVVPLGYVPLLPGDSASGRVGFDVALKEMPKPLLNAVHANFQAWFVPKSAFPQFAGRDELMHAMTGDPIKSLKGATTEERAAPNFFQMTGAGAATNAFAASELATTLGLHVAAGSTVNSDIVDAFNLIYNFRLAAHSSRLQRRKYMSESVPDSTTLPPAFWPSSRLSRVVPDYERALVVGTLDLDVAAGRLPVLGLHVDNSAPGAAKDVRQLTRTGTVQSTPESHIASTLYTTRAANAANAAISRQIFAEMGGEKVTVSLADIDSARKTQAFAKLRTAYAGNDATGFDNDDTIVALLMQGIAVPEDQFKRPWLLDSRRVPVGFAERFATDAANLDASVTLGRASAALSLNVPQQDTGGVIIFTVEVLPERVDERMSDEWLYMSSFDQLPNALRDVQRPEPVDLVPNRRVDAKHSSPNGLYGYEPMNDKWNRDFTRLGGDFYQATPGAGWTENRSAIWQTEIVNPTFSSTHYLAPAPFPHDVFSDQNADAFEAVCRHQLTIVGLTQIGDVLQENGDDYAAIEGAGV